MNIFAKKGDKVVFDQNGGLEIERQHARIYLRPNAEYTVKSVEAGDWRSRVTLKELPDMQFNTCLFSDA